MQEALYQATTLTFEELGFMFPMPDETAEDLSFEDSYTTFVDFHGEFDGRLVVQIENKMLPVIAENMLGEETPLDEEIQLDALCEITNVICGNALPLIAGKKAVFKLNAPEFITSNTDSGAPNAIAHFTLDEGRADVSIYVTEK